MAGFDREILQTLFTGLFEGHPAPAIAASASVQAAALTQFLIDTVDGRANSVDVTKPVTTGYAYINEFKKHVKKEDHGSGLDLYFVKLSLITGKITSEGATKNKFRFQYLDLIVDKKLHNFAKNICDTNSNFLKKQMCKVTISNSHFTSEVYKGKPMLNTAGVLTGIEITAGV